MVNKVILVGRVGKDAEVRAIQGGAKVANITLATTEKYKDREETEWHNVVLWNNLAEVAEKYVKKGQLLYIEGKIKTERYKAQDGSERSTTRIYASSMQMLGGKSDNQSSASAPTPAPQQQKFNPQAVATAPVVDDLPDDDTGLPF